MKKKAGLSLALLIIISSHCFLQNQKQTVVFYSAVSDSTDSSMIKLTQDLFFSQLSSLEQYKVIDKRTELFTSSSSLIQNTDIAFYVEIQQHDTLWECVLNAVSLSTGYHASSKKEYESYYMILLDAKKTLAYVMDNVQHPTQAQIATETSNNSDSPLANDDIPAAIQPTVELLAGTWKGDPSVDKIVILRAGRGFAIFKNGASMNITVSISGNTVSLVQSGKTNASYYPDIPREITLSYAENAEPIAWSLKLSSENILYGDKTTLQPVYDNNKAVAAEPTVISVELTKQD